MFDWINNYSNVIGLIKKLEIILRSGLDRVLTKKYWPLCWWDQEQFKYHSRVKKIFQNYVLKKQMTMTGLSQI
jgi:hypothetical protein